MCCAVLCTALRCTWCGAEHCYAVLCYAVLCCVLLVASTDWSLLLPADLPLSPNLDLSSNSAPCPCCRRAAECQCQPGVAAGQALCRRPNHRQPDRHPPGAERWVSPFRGRHALPPWAVCQPQLPLHRYDAVCIECGLKDRRASCSGTRPRCRACSNWRDSDTGLAMAPIPFDVNVALVPAALRAIEVG